MLIFLALFKLPEWAALSRAQRRFIFQEWVNPLLMRWQWALVKTCSGLLVLVAAIWLGVFQNGSIWQSVVVPFFAVFFLPELMDVALVAWHRQEVSSFIGNHEADLLKEAAREKKYAGY